MDRHPWLFASGGILLVCTVVALLLLRTTASIPSGLQAKVAFEAYQLIGEKSDRRIDMNYGKTELRYTCHATADPTAIIQQLSQTQVLDQFERVVLMVDGSPRRYVLERNEAKQPGL